MGKDDIRPPDPEKGEGQAVVSVTETVPHPADGDSSPGPYEGLDVNRPPVSTNRPDVPIAQSLVAGAGAPQPTEGYTPDNPTETPSTAKVTSDDTVVKVETPKGK